MNTQEVEQAVQEFAVSMFANAFMIGLATGMLWAGTTWLAKIGIERLIDYLVARRARRNAPEVDLEPLDDTPHSHVQPATVTSVIVTDPRVISWARTARMSTEKFWSMHEESFAEDPSTHRVCSLCDVRTEIVNRLTAHV